MVSRFSQQTFRHLRMFNEKSVKKLFKDEREVLDTNILYHTYSFYFL